MTIRAVPILLALAAVILPTACRSAGAPEEEREAPQQARADEPEMPAAPEAPPVPDAPEVSEAPTPANHYSFVFLVTGPEAANLGQAEVQEASTGHRENIRRLAREGVMLLAGPFGDPRPDPSWRGIFVFDEPDLAAARAFTETDPAVEVGAFDMQVHAFATDAPLDRVREDSLAREERGEPFAGRPYVLGIGAPRDAARAAIADLELAGRIAFQGPIERENGADELLFAVVAEDVESVRAELGDGADWTLSFWYATTFLERLAAGE